MTTHYIVETNYVGPNPQQHVDFDHFLIQTAEPRTNSSREIRLHGWLGTTNDRSYTARGGFESLEAARAHLAALLPDGYRTMTPHDYDRADPEDGGAGAVEMVKPGKYAPATRESSVQFCEEGIRADVKAETTDEEIAAMVAEWQELCREHWESELDTDAAREAAEARRAELRAEAAEAAE